MGTNKNVVVSFSIAILLLLSLLLLLTYNSKCNQSRDLIIHWFQLSLLSLFALIRNKTENKIG